MSLHSIRSKINITSPSFIIDNLFMRRTFQGPAGYPQILDELRPLRGRHTYKTSMRSALSDSLQPCLEIWVSLHFVQNHDSVFFSFWSIKPEMLPASMLGDYSRSASSTPSCFPYRTDLLGNLFLITSLLDLLSFLVFWIIILSILSATMLRYYSWVHLRCPLNFFIVVSTYWKPASYRSLLDLSSFGKHLTQVGF
jgi:hypothetical protein